MSVLRVSLFGKLTVQLGEQLVTSLNVGKVQELLCYLLLHRDRPHPREVLADMLWGESSTVQSKGYLRKTLWQLQAGLDPETKPWGGCLLLVEPDWVQLNPQADLWLDVAVFEQAFARVRGVPGAELDSQRIQTLRSAVDIYQGDLLEGWYQDWCLYERERLQYAYLAMLDKLMGYCEAHREYEVGLAYGVRILRYDRARERTHRRLMRLHYVVGDRTAALRQYERCVGALDEELGVRPAKRTAALYEQIRSDRSVGSILAPFGDITVSRAVASPLPQVLGCLEQLQAILAEAQRQVQQHIQAVEQILNSRP